MQAHINGLGHYPDLDTKELEDQCPLEVILVLQIMPFMFVVDKITSVKHGLKGQCVLVAADLKKI